MIEREVENLLEQKLKKCGWIIDVGNKDRNVYRQCPRTEDEIELLKINGNQKFPDFVLYEDNKTKEPIAIIETKRSEHKDLEDAKEQGLMYSKALKAKYLFLYNGNRFITYYVVTGENLYIDGNELTDIIPLTQLQKFNGNVLELTNQAEIKSKSDLINLFKVANNKLREAGINAGVARFTEFSNLLFLKLISELNIDRNYNISKEYLWESYRRLDGDMLLKYINETVIPGLNKKFDTNETNTLFTPLKIRDTIKLKEIVDKLDTLNLAKIDRDIKGDAFEYFIQKYNQTNNDLGEYFTPRHIVKFLNDIIKPKFGEKIYDPFCGTGGMLIVAFERIYNELLFNNLLNDSTLSFLRSETIYGNEISETARITKMNMILSGDGHSNISQQDTFSNPVDNKFDVVISNIPFNMDITTEQANLYYPIVKSGNGLALIHILKSMKSTNPNSRAAIIVPESVLNDKSLKEVREIIVKSGQLQGIISLPCKVFLPYTEAKTSILIFGSENNVVNENLFFYKVENDGFTLTTRRRHIPGINDLDNFISIYNEMKNDDNANKKLSYKNLFYISRENILNNVNKSLLLSQYCDELKEGYIRLSDLLEEIKEKNVDRNPTASITKNEFWGMPLGEDLWGDNFTSVTSDDNSKYTVVKPKYISFNPARANVGSFGINMSSNNLAVSGAYPVFKLNDKMKNKFLPEYIYLEIKYNSIVQEDIVSRSYGTVRQNLNSDDFLKLQIRNISLKEQKQIVNQIKNKFDQYQKLKNTLFNLKLN